VPKLIKELFWNLKVAQNDINEDGINHNFLKAEAKRTEHYSEKARNKLLEEAKMQQKVDIRKFVQSQQEKRGSLATDSSNFSKTKQMIIQMLNQGQQPEQLIKYLLPQSLGSDHLNLTKDQYRAVKEN
jgi:hypothetical protein